MPYLLGEALVDAEKLNGVLVLPVPLAHGLSHPVAQQEG